MAAVWNKLDSGLGSIYSDWLLVRERGPAGAGPVHPIARAGSRLSITLDYTGDADLSELEALGFRTLSQRTHGRATGSIALDDIEPLAAHPKVQLMAFPLPPERSLDKSIPDIHANHADVWTRSGSTFSGITGKGIVIGIIDDGIDIRHPFFRKTDDPLTTRIAALWDQGLIPQTANDPKESSPDEALLDGATAGTYGVEYTGAQINDFLQGKSGALEVRTRDCGGHGTHVASIAAGDGRDDYAMIGVAPEATLVVVKYFDHLIAPESNGSKVNADDLFRDAVTYILKKAEQLTPEGSNTPGMPVVINTSFGSTSGPHDGLTANEDFLDKLFDPATSAGKILVTAAGNESNKDHHAEAKFLADGETNIKFELVDKRTARTSSDTCYEAPDYNNLSIYMWYADGPNDIEVTLTLPGDLNEFNAPASGAPQEKGDFQGRQWRMTHKREEQKLVDTGRPSFHRKTLQIEFVPNINGEHISSNEYFVKLKAKAGMEVHIWTTDRGAANRIRVADADDPATVTSNSTIGSHGGAKNVITVGSYNAEVTPARPLAWSSSKGPLVDYGGPGPKPVKPEIAAPGMKIDAASSRNTKKKSKKRKLVTSKDGTSMAAPHVSGVIALMLQKKKTLTAADVVQIWKDNPRTDAGADALEPTDALHGRVDAQISVTKTVP